MNIDQLLFRLTLHIGTFSIAAAILIGIGNGSVQLPALVLFCVVASWIYTDHLGWIKLPRFVVYIAMISGAAWAMFDYAQAAGPDQLYPVANLLVYAQLPLFFQQKSRRIFEQLGVFLLLEMVVASLVNDDMLFGLILVPTLALGGATLILFCNYCTAERSGQVSLRSGGWLHAVRKWMSFRRNDDVTPTKNVVLVLSENSQYTVPRSRLAWATQAMTIGGGMFIFAIAYFYFLPRLNSGTYSGNALNQPTVGFTDMLTLDQMGKLLQSSRPVLRLQLIAEDNRPIKPISPPYLTGAVLNSYLPSAERGYWRADEYETFGQNRRFHRTPEIPDISEVHPLFLENQRPVIARFIEQASQGKHVMSLPPFAKGTGLDHFEFDHVNWLLNDNERDNSISNNARRYELLTLMEKSGIQASLIPTFRNFAAKQPDLEINGEEPKKMSEHERTSLTRFPSHRFRSLLEFRDRILSQLSEPNQNPIDRAQALQRSLAFSTEFQYTLDLTMKRDRAIDPIEDFIRNHKRGHCQYFASALVMLLRSLDIPTSIVVGYRPNDFNTVGDYFLVRELHAHTWVQAYFTRAEFEASSRELPEEYGDGAWLRLDPTPAVAGSNSSASIRQPGGQSFDFAEQLWRDYVMNLDRSSQSELVRSLSDVSDPTYEDYWSWLKERLNQWNQWNWINRLGSPEVWFSWQGATLVLLVGISASMLWRFGSWARPWRWLKRRISAVVPKSRSRIRIAFYRKAARILARFGHRRASSQTQFEFIQSLKPWMDQRDPTHGASESAHLLTQKYYQLRFGGKSNLESSEQLLVDQAIEKLKRLKP